MTLITLVQNHYYNANTQLSKLLALWSERMLHTNSISNSKALQLLVLGKMIFLDFHLNFYSNQNYVWNRILSETLVELHALRDYLIQVHQFWASGFLLKEVLLKASGG